MNIIKKISFILTIIGALNWGMIGFFNIDMVALLFGPLSMLSRAVYGLVGLSAVWLVFDHSCPVMEHKHA